MFKTVTQTSTAISPATYAIASDLGAMIDFWSRQTEMAIDLNAQLMRMTLETAQAYGSLPLSVTEIMLTGLSSVSEAPTAPTKAAAPAPKPAKPAVKMVAQTPAPKPKAANPVAQKPVAKKPAAEKPLTQKAVKPAAAKAAAPAAKTPVKSSAKPAPVKDPRPAALVTPRGGKADDLVALKGVGPKLVKQLADLGIFHFDQVASWSDANLDWVDANLTGPKGVARRNGWIAQAQSLYGKSDAKSGAKTASAVDKAGAKE